MPGLQLTFDLERSKTPGRGDKSRTGPVAFLLGSEQTPLNPCNLEESGNGVNGIAFFHLLRQCTRKYTFFLKRSWNALLIFFLILKIQFSSVTQSCLTLCHPMDCSTPGLPVHHHLLELTQTHVFWVSDATQPSHALSSPLPPAFNLPHNQGLFQWVSSSHQVAKVLEFELQHQSFQWIFRTDLL